MDSKCVILWVTLLAFLCLFGIKTSNHRIFTNNNKRSLVEITADELDVVTLQCEDDEVTWYRDNVLMEKRMRTSIYNGSLLLFYATREDQGVYSCIGRTRRDFRLRVGGQRKPTYAIRFSDPSNTSVTLTMYPPSDYYNKTSDRLIVSHEASAVADSYPSVAVDWKFNYNWRSLARRELGETPLVCFKKECKLLYTGRVFLSEQGAISLTEYNSYTDSTVFRIFYTLYFDSYKLKRTAEYIIKAEPNTEITETYAAASSESDTEDEWVLRLAVIGLFLACAAILALTDRMTVEKQRMRRLKLLVKHHNYYYYYQNDDVAKLS
ncbi:membrane protein [Crucian carp herpesvirus]|uniref:Membrane ORF146 n=1 Tax=Cyprinid herpesvirus 2 TaxID=317878 RepID=A0A0Y0CFD1_CYHV2|nr:membrane ORF146 [Cyprinid herpesvirus 2]APB92990.1 membrane protein [Crucian carp herpesvirus]QAU54864.1 membrane protein ORF146 [Cyprinid herpesvirus 2]